jgi:putative membrane protein
MRILIWLLRALLFFTLFAFALNNQHEAFIRWFFGYEWRTPMVFVVLAAFAFGCAFGVLAMLPSWWRHRRIAYRNERDQPGGVSELGGTATGPATLPDNHPPRDGL